MYFLDSRFLVVVPVFILLYWASGSLRSYVLLAVSVGWIGVFSPATLLSLSGMVLIVVTPIVQAAAHAR